ncbi:aromatic ring-hydroxylating oxygenase subunit alpha [Dongia deserti]|uniref:aromatic ring-hydroxylating oxygenase subunit alpha n=1 Tax=Dongia deserti TaxID=2268030 RepID=UPI000E64EDAC|nr:aromatic ring-hydroxylating dioxygenase subunit alpha [Dongia deserti]
MNSFIDIRHPERIYETEPLPAWTYLNAELLELEYERVILPSWQFVCHQNQVREAGDFATLDLWRDSIIVMRGKDGVLRAFQNACRHRGARLLDGDGTCKHRITCPYHAWSYQFDGKLAAVPSEKTFPGLDKSQLGLKELELEIFCGLVFVRIAGGGPSIREQWGELAQELAPYRIEEMVPAVGVQISEEWACNWKVALDNYLDNYHVPFGHPGLNRLMDNELACTINRHGISFSKSAIRARESHVWSERMYQRLAPRAFANLPEDVRTTWLFGFMPVNIGFDVFPDSMDIFQILPKGATRCVIRTPLFVRPDVRREARAMQFLANRINAQIGHEDKALCERVQAGLSSYQYQAGPLSEYEMPVKDMHARLRAACPIVTLKERPMDGTLCRLNQQMIEGAQPASSVSAMMPVA